MKLEEAIDFMSSEAKKLSPSQFDILGSESESTGIEIFEGKVKNTELANSRGIGIRFFLNGSPGISYTEKLTKEAIAQTVKDAFGNAKITDPMDLDLPEMVALATIDLDVYREELNQVKTDDLISIGIELEKIALAQDKRILNVPYLGVSMSSGNSMILNSKGVRYSNRSNGISGGLGVVAKVGNISKMGSFSRGGRSINIFDTEFMAKTAVDRAIELLDAESVPSKKYPVVFSNRVSGSIIGMFLSPYFAEAVQKGQSRLEGKVGEAIGVPTFTMSSQPHLVGFPGSGLFDSEGVPTRSISIVENGILQTYLYNLESAKKANVVPTGTGARSYAGKAGTGISNLIVEKGTKSLNELLSIYPECLYITKLEGSSGCSAISGEISIGVQGHLYTNGERNRAVDKITLSSNYFELIKNIDFFSNEYNDNFSSVKVPDFLVKEMNVAG